MIPPRWFYRGIWAFHRRFIAASPLYAEYRDANTRDIPVVVLEPRDGA